MKLLINTATTHKGGGVQVAYSFIQECLNHPEYRFIVILGLKLQELIDPKDFPENFIFEALSYRPAEKILSFKDQAKPLKKIEEKYQPDIVFTTSGPAYWRPRSPHVMGYNLPHYIYSDSPYFTNISPKERLKWKLKGALIKKFTRKDADAYVVQTEDVNNRLGKWIKKTKIFTVSNTYGNQFENSKLAKLKLPPLLKREFRFLLLSSYYKHKNIEFLNEVVALLKVNNQKHIKFVLTLPESDFKNAIEEKHEGQIINLGPQLPSECPSLYNECQAIFLPTLLECFSATYAEAMQMKVPIITTDMGFSRSVCGKAALYYSPMDANDAVEKILMLYNDENLRKKLVLHGLREKLKFNSAKERAGKYLEICQKLMYNS